MSLSTRRCTPIHCRIVNCIHIPYRICGRCPYRRHRRHHFMFAVATFAGFFALILSVLGFAVSVVFHCCGVRRGRMWLQRRRRGRRHHRWHVQSGFYGAEFYGRTSASGDEPSWTGQSVHDRKIIASKTLHTSTADRQRIICARLWRRRLLDDLVEDVCLFFG